jgi:hypothetical protein
MSKLARIHKSGIDDRIEIPDSNRVGIKNVVLTYEIGNVIHVNHVKSTSRANLVGMLEYAKHVILSEW